MSVSTQLRLISRTEAPADPARRRARARHTETGRADATDAGPRPLRGRTNTTRRPATRRAVHWEGRWRLDEQTRQVGRAGIASAREALARAHGDDAHLRRAS